MSDTAYIAIEGPIGVGKTSLAEKLTKMLNGRLVQEKVEGNPFLSSFYESRNSFAFQTQLFFLLSRYKQQMDIMQQSLFQQCTVADYLFDRDRIFAYINLCEDEIRLYEEVYSLLKSRIPQPDLVVYLQADLNILKQRIRFRGREFEKNISDDYLEEVSKAFNHYFFNYSETPLLIVNTNKIDFVLEEVDMGDLVKKIMSHKQGVEYYSPLGSV